MLNVAEVMMNMTKEKESKTMSIVEIKAKKMFGGAGNFVYLAEAVVEEEGAETAYVTVQYYDGEEYTVAGKSVYDSLVSDGEVVSELAEEYTTYEEATDSKYRNVFWKLRTLIDGLE